MSSVLVVLNIAMKCMPACLPVNGLFVKLVDAGVGAFQAVWGAFVLPPIAKTIANSRSSRRTALLSFASMLNTCLVPIFVVMYLDGACLAQWAVWWTPCDHQHAQMFCVDSRNVLQNEKFQLLHQDDICRPKLSGALSSARTHSLPYTHLS